MISFDQTAITENSTQLPQPENGPENLVQSPSTGSNLFDPAQLRLSQDFESMVGVKKLVLSVPVRKPNRQQFNRVHKPEEGESWQLETAVLDLKQEGEIYLVHKSLWSEIPGEIVRKAFFTAIDRQGAVFLWPINLPRSDGRQDSWSRSALEAAQLAMKTWVRIAANQSLGAYDVFQATGSMPEPEWPSVSFGELLNIAFKDRYLTSLDHPVLRRLRGEL